MSDDRAQAGRMALVTGGTDGIGREVAWGLARAGHRVLIVGRDAQKGDRAAQKIRQTTGNPNVEFLPADLSLTRETRRLADEVTSRWPRLNYLVHSAGIVRGRRELTDEGNESNFAVNYLSRFVLTQRLLPLLKASGRPGGAARIVIVSGAAQKGTIYFDDVNLTSKFGVLRVVGQFCRANDIFTVEQARRLTGSATSNVTITCLKMGVVKTNIRSEFPKWMKLLVPMVMDPLLGQTPQEAAAPVLSLLLSGDYEETTGALFMKIKKFKRLTPNAGVTAPEIGKRLWTLSQRLADQFS